MKPPPLEYLLPRTLGEALDLLAAERAATTVLAGGQSLVPLLNLRRVRPRQVLDINRLAELGGVEITADEVRIGALVRMSELERHPGLRAALPVLVQAVRLVAHPQIRNRGTIGGSLCHADAAAELPTVVLTLGGLLHLASASGTRVLRAADFFLGGTRTRRTARRDDELLTAVTVPRRAGMAFHFAEISRRPNDPALAGVCAGLALDGAAVTGVRVGAAGLSDRPVRLSAVERLLTGSPVSALACLEQCDARADETMLRLATAVADDLAGLPGPAGDMFRRALLLTALRRTLSALGAGDPEVGR